MSCKFAGSDQPRIMSGRHREGCADQYDTDTLGCAGCQPCLEPHCRVCYRTHADGTCAECLAETREALHSIARMCGALPEEVEHRGIQGEAMVLLGPVADPERWGFTETAYLSGRLPEGWIEGAHGKGCPLLTNDACSGCAGGERHPLTVLLTWQMVARDALEHSEAPDAELATAVDYLDQNLTYLGGFEHLPFEDFARDLRTCQAHLESVLHDQRQGDRANVGCFECGGDLERRIGKEGLEDHWTCARCRRRYTSPEYNFALRAAIEASVEDSA